MNRELRTETLPGNGPLHHILVPGLVPDGPETFLRQQGLLRGQGPTTTITYPYEGFDLDLALAGIRKEVLAAHASGRAPVLMGVSVGGGLCLELLRRQRERGESLPLAGLVLVSPLGSTADLAPLLKRLIKPIIDEQERGGDPEGALERGRSFFKQLASRAVPERRPEPAWQTVLRLLTPAGIRDLENRRIRARIERTLDALPASGAVERVLALPRLPGLEAGQKTRQPLCTAPTLLLWGSKERHTLDMDGPGTRVLCRPDLAVRHFPTCEVQWVYQENGEEVPHASLLKHAPAFNGHLRRFVRRVRHGLRSTPARAAEG